MHSGMPALHVDGPHRGASTRNDSENDMVGYPPHSAQSEGDLPTNVRGLQDDPFDRMVGSNSSVELRTPIDGMVMPPNIAVRKSHSAAGSYHLHSRISAQATKDGAFEEVDGASENRRPFTVATSSLTKSHATTKKKKPLAKKGASLAANVNEHRPCSADLNGWGDFDADRLLHEDFSFPNNPVEDAEDFVDVGQAPVPDDPEPERLRPRRIRHSAPGASIHTASEDFPSLLQVTDSAPPKTNKELQRPRTHVLPQRSLAMVVYDSAQPSAGILANASRPNGLKGRAQTPTGGGPPPFPATHQNRLPRLHQQGSGSCPSLSLFGTSLPESAELRATVFERFRDLWTLIPSRPPSACVAASCASPHQSSSSTLAAGAAVPSKSPVECSVALMKLCKSIGISLSANASSSPLTFWNTATERGDVEFESFCELAIRNAIQPALQHFQMDASVDEYVSTVDRIVQNVIATATAAVMPHSGRNLAAAVVDESSRVKELTEIHSLFPQWKLGVASMGKLKPVAQTSGDEASATHHPAATETQQEADPSRLVTPAYSSRREFPFQLSADEAKSTHNENIRRKVQLHKSWQQPSRSVVLNVTSNIATLHAVSECSTTFVRTTAVVQGSMRNTNADCGRPTPNLLIGSQRCDDDAKGNQEHQRSEPAASSKAQESSSGNSDLVPEVRPENEAQSIDEQVLVCAECATGEAVLWCASCFAVFCAPCWQNSHLLSVDTSSVTENQGCSTSMLAPTAKPLRTNGATTKNTNNPPPVAMMYLPTKLLAAGKLAKGACSKWKHQGDGEDGAEDAEVVAGRHATKVRIRDQQQHELLAVTSHPLLPPLQHRSKSPTMDDEDPAASESTRHTVKSLLDVGATLPHSSSSRSSSSSQKATNAAASRKHKDPTKRHKLHPASVSVDPRELLRD